MVRVLFFYTAGNKPTGFQADGHALFFERGTGKEPKYDLLCCAVSTVLQQLTIGLHEVVKISMHTHRNKGSLQCSWDTLSLDMEKEKQTETLIQASWLFLEQLKEFNEHFVLEKITES